MAGTNPPTATTAEEELVAAAIINPTILDDYDEVATLPVAAFYSERNRIIWRAITSLHAADDPIDLPTVIENLRQSKMLDRVGGVPHLLGVTSDAMGVTLNAPMYARHVNDTYKRRLIMRACKKAFTDAASNPGYEDTLKDLEDTLTNIGDTQFGTTDRDAFDIADALPDGSRTITTGFTPIDAATGGFPLGDLTIMAGRTSMGKSALLHGSAFAMGNCMFFTPDQPKPEIFAAEASRRSNVPIKLLRAGEASDAQVESWRTALDSLRDVVPKSVEFKDGPLTLSTLRREVRRAAQRGRQAVFVDTLQRIAPEKSVERRHFMVEVTGTLKDLAREYGLAVIAASQLKRDIDERENKVPLLSDLSESKTIEEDANMVLFLYREKYYDVKAPVGDIADVIVAKHKTSERQARVQLMYDAPFMRFKPLG